MSLTSALDREKAYFQRDILETTHTRLGFADMAEVRWLVARAEEIPKSKPFNVSDYQTRAYIYIMSLVGTRTPV